MTRTTPTLTAGGAIFPRLKALGVDYVFANSGTDFPPIIEGLAEAAAKGEDLPEALVIPHEHCAMGMAHGYYLISGQPQAVMMHTNVGLANGVIGAINAACEHVPMLLMSGVTPVAESGRFGARTVPIGWGQEMRDQAALMRESCKWENELRFPEQIGPFLDRAHAVASSTPKGPVYLSLPRETLCEPIDATAIAAPPSIRPTRVGPHPDAIATAAEWLATAERPLILAQRGCGSAAAFDAFAAWAEDWAMPVCSYWASHLTIATDHPCHIGADPADHIGKADVIVVIDALAPWWPDRHTPAASAKVIQIGPDPLFPRFPTRTFRSDLSIGGETADTIPALIAAMKSCKRDPKALDIRRATLAEAAESRRQQEEQAIRAGTAKGITKEYVSLELGAALEGHSSSVFGELGCILGPLTRREHLSFFSEPHSGGLGWSFPAALGAKLADRARTIVAAMGDGSYMFANPTACHQVAEALDLGIVVLILNNEEWGAVRRSVTGLYPDGHAARANRMPLTALKPSPDFTRTATASRGWARRVTAPDDVRPAIDEALAIADSGRTAVLDIAVLPG